MRGPTLKPPALPCLLVSTVPGLAVWHMLQSLRRAQFMFPHEGHAQSSGANIPARHSQVDHTGVRTQADGISIFIQPLQSQVKALEMSFWMW